MRLRMRIRMHPQGMPLSTTGNAPGRGGRGGEGAGRGRGAGGGAHVRARACVRVRACTRRLTCPLLPNANLTSLLMP
jgi:hypothetical protein